MAAHLSPFPIPHEPWPPVRLEIHHVATIPDRTMDAEAGEPQEDVNSAPLAAGLINLQIKSLDILNTSKSIENIGDTLLPSGSAERAASTSQCVSECIEATNHDACPGYSPSKRPFDKWIRSIHRKARQRSPLLGSQQTTLPFSLHGTRLDGSLSPRPSMNRESSSSGSSFRFVSAIRSVSVSLASASIMTRSRRNTLLSRRISRTDRSSKASGPGPRMSEDSTMLDKVNSTDAAATERALQRRRVLEELIATEEGYIGDIRLLMNASRASYKMDTSSNTFLGLRSSINKNLGEIVELHEEILGNLHQAVPFSEYTQLELPPESATDSCQPAPIPGHRRWASLDGSVRYDGCISCLPSVQALLAEPQVAAEVSRAFAKKMNRFFIYKEYGAKYELMIKDVASANEAMPQWETYQKGIETLASILDSEKHSKEKSRKAMTMGDLLVKPIQRICKYPLLFAELLKHTPVSDCPNSHMEVDNVLTRMREAMAEINRAADDSLTKSVLERTWLLQDRLVFNNQRLDAVSKDRIRAFGHVRLCGTLHICWQSPTGVDGRYFICLLYRDVLCLASAGKADQIYIIHACINLQGTSVVDADNGRGLQCHTAPFSWKLVFECNHQLYEMIMTACTSKEEMEWRTRLSRPANEEPEPRNTNLSGSLDLEMKSLGAIFGKPGTIARRISIHRATTVGPKSPLCQVVLKNTSLVRDSVGSASGALTINRSQSLLASHSRIPVLAPARGERARLEALISDVWSREVLPLPGMTARARSEHLVRTSASTVMRKLSVASITSSFARRSTTVVQKPYAPEAKSISGLRRRCWKSSVEDHWPGLMGTDADTLRRRKRARTVQSFSVRSEEELAVSEQPAEERLASAGRDEIALRVSSANSIRTDHCVSLTKHPTRSADEGCYRHTPMSEVFGYERVAKAMGQKSERIHGFKRFFR
ncbi:hypothetical protein HIM_02526 [Hirsutella minnesotensis 3608]|nr:hypothetical protein HIM_02526 [Hirsutella minnesotensis 3608]